MTDTPTATRYDTIDVEYLRHGDRPLMATIYLPEGPGPFPALVEVHGGAWSLSDRFTEKLRHQAMASHGIVSIALDFRSGQTDPYPASVQDVNYAVRWAKLHAPRFKTRAELIGLSGQSSGGHIAMLVAMKPNDRRYAALPLPAGAPAFDANVHCVVLSWPVINPLSRYRYAKRLAASDPPPGWAKAIVGRHDDYWRTEAAMAEGSPTLILERGEPVKAPPAVWYMGRPDVLHDYKDDESAFPGNEPERFIAAYQRAGGEISLEIIDAAPHAGHAPDLARTGDLFARMVAWVKAHLQP